MYWVRKFFWKILGFDYKMMLNKTDYVLLKNDNHSQIGARTYDNGAKVWRWTEASLKIGKYCSIANNVNFIVDEGHHQISSITNFPLANNLFKNESLINDIEKKVFFSAFKQKEGITVGNDVWIGMGAYIMPGVNIGNGVTIAANSVVIKNVEDYSVVGGVPAKLIRKKHSDLNIRILNKISWWNWNEEIVKQRIDDFYLNPDTFIDKYKK